MSRRRHAPCFIGTRCSIAADRKRSWRSRGTWRKQPWTAPSPSLPNEHAAANPPQICATSQSGPHLCRVARDCAQGRSETFRSGLRHSAAALDPDLDFPSRVATPHRIDLGRIRVSRAPPSSLDSVPYPMPPYRCVTMMRCARRILDAARGRSSQHRHARLFPGHIGHELPRPIASGDFAAAEPIRRSGDRASRSTPRPPIRSSISALGAATIITGSSACMRPMHSTSCLARASCHEGRALLTGEYPWH